MQSTFLIRTSSHPPRADKSAMGAINDSVGKICTDKLTSAGTRQNPAFAAREAAYSSSACEEQGHETRGRSKDCCSFPLHMQVLLIMLGPSFAERRCTDMLTKFTNRVIYRAHRRFIGHLGSCYGVRIYYSICIIWPLIRITQRTFYLCLREKK